MQKSLWYWTKHDVASYIRNNIKDDTEFTSDSLYKKITGFNFFGYGDRNLSDHLSALQVDGYLSSRFESVKMTPIEIDDDSVSSIKRSKFSNRFGSKTITVYKKLI